MRKPEKGTIPKVFYIGADDSVLQPEIATRPFIYKEGQVLLRPLGSPTPDPSRPGDARVDYDTPHEKPWGLDMALYLLTKGIATGTMLLTAILWWLGDRSAVTRLVGPAISLVFITAHRPAPRRRSRAAGALLLHPHAPQLAIVDGLGRVLPDRAGRDLRAVDCRRVAGHPGVLHGARLAGDRRLDSGDLLHRLPVRARPGARPVAGAARDVRSARAGRRRRRGRR